MKKYTILAILLGLILSVTTTNAAPVGSAFSYQGELVDNGSPANGSFDIIIEPFAVETGGTNLGQLAFTVTVENGLFTIPVVDFGDAVFNGDEIWLQLFTKPTADPTFTPLTPRQRLNAVPYAVQAEFLAANGASNGEILQFDGSNWVAAASSGLSPWSESGGNINYGAGNVGIGVASPTSNLHIEAATGDNPIRVRIDGDTKFKVEANGSTTIGTNFAATPNEGLYVNGDVKQRSTSNGLMKYMVRMHCTDTPTIIQEYNGTNVVGTANVTFDSTGLCYIELPFDVTNNYLSVGMVFADLSGANVVKNASCFNLGVNIYCSINDGSGTRIDGAVDVIVY